MSKWAGRDFHLNLDSFFESSYPENSTWNPESFSMELLKKKREFAESLIERMDELLPPFVFERPAFAVKKEYPVIPATEAIVNEIEPVLEAVENQLKELSGTKLTLKSLEKEVAMIRNKRV